MGMHMGLAEVSWSNVIKQMPHDSLRGLILTLLSKAQTQLLQFVVQVHKKSKYWSLGLIVWCCFLD